MARATRRAPQGRLNAGQKVNAIVTAVFALLFAVTGFLLWYGERDTRFRFAQTILIHDWLMYVSFFLFIGHLYLSVIHPATRHALSGMTRGWVERVLGPAPSPEMGGDIQPSTGDARRTSTRRLNWRPPSGRQFRSQRAPSSR